MLSDSGRLLRSLLFAQTEAARLGYAEASDQIASAAQIIASTIDDDHRTILSDEIFEVVERMVNSRQEPDNKKF